MTEIKTVTQQASISFKKFEKLAVKLRYAAIGIPTEQGLCAPFNRTIAIHPNRVHLDKKGLVREALMDWHMLLVDMRVRLIHVNELIPQAISDIDHMDVSAQSVYS